MGAEANTIRQLGGSPELLVGHAGAGAQELPVWPVLSSQVGRAGARTGSGLARDSIYRRALLIADVLAIFGAFLFATALANRSQALTAMFAAAVPIFLIGAKLTGLYDRDESLMHKTTLDEAPTLFQLATLASFVAWLAGSLLVAGTLSRNQAVFVWCSLTALLLCSRTVARWAAGLLAQPERCLFVGEASAARALRSRMGGRHALRAELVGQIEPQSVSHWTTDGFSGGRLAEIRQMARALDVHRVIISPGWSGAEGDEMLNLVRSLNAVGICVSLLPRLLDAVGSSVEFDDIHGITVMGVKRVTLTRSSVIAKRLADILVSLIALALLAPLMALFALLIKLDSAGPVLFRQHRVGLRGAHFEMFKFRTMVADAEAIKEQLRDRNESDGGLFKIVNDPRITRVGRLLRRSSLDELPQLLNVLRGQMSLVGPRPLILEEDSQIGGWDRKRLELKPGMTGPWQILGPVRVPLSEMVAIDYLYVANWSLWSDIKVLLRTVPHVIARRGI